MMSDEINIEVKGPIAWIRLNRPEHLNSLTNSMLKEITESLSVLAADKENRVIILTGNGRGFCAGTDLTDFNNLGSSEDDIDLLFLDLLSSTFNSIRSFKNPIICGLNGVTVAGGLELAMCCDFIISADNAMIGDVHSKYGVFPAAGGTALLPKYVGLNNAKYMLFTGETYSAQRLLEMGLVQEVVENNKLESRLEELAENICQKSKIGISKMKNMANRSIILSNKDALELELKIAKDHCRTDDMREGLKAFIEKREPKF